MDPTLSVNSKVTDVRDSGTKMTGEGGGCSYPVDCPWRREVYQMQRELDSFRHRVRDETQLELTAMEDKLVDLRAETEALKRTLEQENRELLRQKAGLERENKAQMEASEEANRSYEQTVTNLTNIKRQLELKCTGLEEKIEDRDKRIVELNLNVMESKSRAQQLEREYRRVVEENDGLLCTSIEMKQQFEHDIHTVLRQSEEKLTAVKNYFDDQMQVQVAAARLSSTELTNEIRKRKDTVAQLMTKTSMREEEFKKTAGNMQTMVKGALKDVQESLSRLELEREDALIKKESVERELSDLIKEFNVLTDRITKHRSVVQQLVGQAVAGLRTEEGATQLQALNLGTPQDDDSFEDLTPTLDIREKRRKILHGIKEEEKSLRALINLMAECQKTMENQQNRLLERNDELESASQKQKCEYVQQTVVVNQKLKLYKKLICKLRKKLEQAKRQEFLRQKPQVTESAVVQNPPPKLITVSDAAVNCRQTSTESSNGSLIRQQLDALDTSSLKYKSLLNRAEHFLEHVEDRREANVDAQTFREGIFTTLGKF